MGLPAKLVYAQLHFFKPLVANLSLETIRRGQDKLGELMEALHKRDVLVRAHTFDSFEGAWIIPKDERRQGVILYLHGGGYTCGDLEYAKGFGATLADEEGVRVFCAAYRLAPESPFPQRWTMRWRPTAICCPKGTAPVTFSCAEKAPEAGFATHCA